MVGREIPHGLQIRVYRYLEVQQKELQQGNSIGDRGFMTSLSTSLQVQLVESLNRLQVCRHPFFASLEWHAPVIKRICLEAKTTVYAGGDIVFQEGAVAENM